MVREYRAENRTLWLFFTVSSPLTTEQFHDITEIQDTPEGCIKGDSSDETKI